MALSRQSSHNTDAGNHSKVKGLNISVHKIDEDVSECKLKNIREETHKDDTMQILIKHTLEGWPESQDKFPDIIKEFYSFHYDLSMIDGLVLKGTSRIIIPERLRKKCLK